MTVPEKTLWETRKLEKTLMKKSQLKLTVESTNARTLVDRNVEVTKTVGRRADVVAVKKCATKMIRRGDFDHRIY